jgi:hypothetical protein
MLSLAYISFSINLAFSEALEVTVGLLPFLEWFGLVNCGHGIQIRNVWIPAFAGMTKDIVSYFGF